MSKLRVQKIHADSRCEYCQVKPVKARNLCDACWTRQRRSGVLSLIAPKMPTELNELQIQMMEGLMLGDGCLFKYKPSHLPYLAITRSAVDLEYLKWQYEVFEPFMSREVYQTDTFDKRTQKVYHQCFLVSRHAEAFESYYNYWYENKKKILPDNLTLTPLSLAIWFCDDGWIGHSCSEKRLKIQLSTHCFPEKNVRNLAQILSERFNVNFRVGKASNGSHTILGSDKATRAFIDEIDTVFPESMTRKAIWRQ